MRVQHLAWISPLVIADTAARAVGDGSLDEKKQTEHGREAEVKLGFHPRDSSGDSEITAMG